MMFDFASLRAATPCPLPKALQQLENTKRPLRVGVLFSGGQAAGGHNVITGLYAALKQLSTNVELVGFLGGAGGLIKGAFRPLTGELLGRYHNQGGFDLIGSGRTKIETPEQFQSAKKVVTELNLDGLVVIGGDDSNTNAAFLAEEFKKEGLKTVVVGVPKTIDGDLKNKQIEISFGFDTASKIYSELVGNLLRDLLSAQKYYFFIKLMGRTASHLTLECALKTQPNLTFISEEVAQKKLTLSQVTEQICDLVERRAVLGKAYGAILIPEGLIEFMPAGDLEKLPKEIQEQLKIERDPHGNVQVSKIDTERLLMRLVERELARRGFKGSFQAQPFFFGYEGRCAYPSAFDASYCYALGHVAAVLVAQGKNGMMACLRGLSGPVEGWEPVGVPLASMMGKEIRQGKEMLVIKKALVDLEGSPFKVFASQRKTWELEDHYRFPGPIQYFGPQELVDETTLTLILEGL
jgi:pyrophosphate--fructose-6-phosphate 1-phosphotransferase